MAERPSAQMRHMGRLSQPETSQLHRTCCGLYGLGPPGQELIEGLACTRAASHFIRQRVFCHRSSGTPGGSGRGAAVGAGPKVPLDTTSAWTSSTCTATAVVAVSARWLGTPVIAVEARPSPDTRVRRYVGRFRSGEVQFLPIMVTRTAWLATSPTALYHALSFYGSHPDPRTELGTPDAVDRISSGRAVGQQEP